MPFENRLRHVERPKHPSLAHRRHGVSRSISEVRLAIEGEIRKAFIGVPSPLT